MKSNITFKTIKAASIVGIILLVVTAIFFRSVMWQTTLGGAFLSVIPFFLEYKRESKLDKNK